MAIPRVLDSGTEELPSIMIWKSMRGTELGENVEHLVLEMAHCGRNYFVHLVFHLKSKIRSIK